LIKETGPGLHVRVQAMLDFLRHMEWNKVPFYVLTWCWK